ncbi:hypothetical protein C923_01171 [Plasmodium falciparum UGT5.1]|uniref:Uncharacterized protein n=1 Tax=Plasmodium falciparum UGT5.1 TaxID=1237627 RepID=W7JSV2_PLAFA|nr:hypothetical protein C923_01171 [Plasmodium falciparum UGT5.1]
MFYHFTYYVYVAFLASRSLP